MLPGTPATDRRQPAVYLIDAAGFVRHKRFGEVACGESEEKIRDLLAKRDRVSG